MVKEAAITHTLRIDLDDAEAVFQPGETVRGRVVLTLSGDCRSRGVVLNAIGTEATSWGAQPTYIARTRPLDRALDLWRPQRAEDALPAGAHDFPFAIELPADLPPSFEGILTEIGYGLKAKVDLPYHIDLHAEAGFLVMARAPSNEDAPASVEARDESSRRIVLELPRTVYRLGEAVSGVVRLARPIDDRSRRLTVEIQSRERGEAQGIRAEHVEREADVRIGLEHIAGDSEHPFTFRTPNSATPTFNGGHSELAWYVAARLDIPREPDLIVETKLVVTEGE